LKYSSGFVIYFEFDFQTEVVEQLSRAEAAQHSGQIGLLIVIGRIQTFIIKWLINRSLYSAYHLSPINIV